MKRLLIILFAFLTLTGFGQNEQFIDSTFAKSKRYKDSFVRDGGEMESDRLTKAYMLMAEQEGIAESIEFGWIGAAALKKRQSTIYEYATKLYDVFGNNHATQTTENNQLFISGNIAENEQISLKNPRLGVRSISHSDIAFSSSSAWTVTTMLRPYWLSNAGETSGRQNYVYLSTNNGYGLMLSRTATAFGILDNSAASTTIAFNSISYIGKNTLYTLTYNGLGSLILYVNGIQSATASASPTMTFRGLNGLREYSGTISSHIIRSEELSADQVLAEYELLRDIYPDMFSVEIGEENYTTSNLEMVATPLGIPLSHVTTSANTEKITATADRDFSSDTGWWTKGSGVSIGSGVATYTSVGAGVGLTKASQMTVGTWYKATYTLTRTGGTFRFGSQGVIRSSSGTYTEYMKAAATTLGFYAVTTFTGTLDDISVQEVGWADVDDLYAYLTTTGGYTDYNALKECAAWAYTSNDNSLGAIYGKLYNAYGKDLLKTDIATQANWGWHIATEAELTQFATNDGYRIKAGGSDYWTTANGTNTTGFTALGGGIRNATTGVFEGLKDSTAFWCGDADKVLMLFDDGTAEITTVDKTFGAYVRLVQD
jgi:uncharacterized protein (TIGR02145 family)